MQVENSPRLHPRLHRDRRNGAPTIDLTRFTEYSGNIPLNRVRPSGFTQKMTFQTGSKYLKISLKCQHNPSSSR